MEDRYVTLDGVTVRYREAGEGDTLVLVHGITRSLEDWEDSLVRLARDFHVIALDLIGFGRSDKPDVPYSMPGLARFLRAFLDGVGVGPAIVVGSSLGGAVALQFAAMYPARTLGLVLVGSAGFGRDVSLSLRLATVPGVGEALSTPTRASVALVLRDVFFDASFVTRARIDRELAIARTPGTRRAFLSVVRAFGSWRGVRFEWQDAITKRLRTANVPMLIVWGRQDRILPVTHVKAARARYPHATFHVFDRCGHFPHIERADAFCDLVRAFAASVRACEAPPTVGAPSEEEAR